MYNKYELLWLWYYYHTEKADLIICSGLSPDGDPDCRFPANGGERYLSNMNATNNRRIMYNVAGLKSELHKYQYTFSRMKNAKLFEIYEQLDKTDVFHFIGGYIHKQRTQDSEITLLNDKLFKGEE